MQNYEIPPTWPNIFFHHTQNTSQMPPKTPLKPSKIPFR